MKSTLNTAWILPVILFWSVLSAVALIRWYRRWTARLVVEREERRLRIDSMVREVANEVRNEQ